MKPAPALLTTAVVGALALCACQTPPGRQAPATDGGAATSAADTNLADADEALCERACAVTTMLPCPDQQSCLPGCRKSFVAGRCLPEHRALYACVAASEPAGFVCISGRTGFRAGYCKSEGDALLGCLISSADAGP